MSCFQLHILPGNVPSTTQWCQTRRHFDFSIFVADLIINHNFQMLSLLTIFLYGMEKRIAFQIAQITYILVLIRYYLFDFILESTYQIQDSGSMYVRLVRKLERKNHICLKFVCSMVQLFNFFFPLIIVQGKRIARAKHQSEGCHGLVVLIEAMEDKLQGKSFRRLLVLPED